MDIDHYLVSAARRAHALRLGRTYLIGREQGAEIHIQDALISRRHAEIIWRDDAWVLKDLGSRNGTLINGDRVNGEQTLLDQDRLQCGGQVFTYHMVPPGSDIGTLSSNAPQISDEVTMGAGVSASDIFTQGAAFSGEIGDGGVFDLLQFLGSTRKTGRMDLIKGLAPVGAVGVIDGSIRDATYLNQQGIDALIALVKSGCDHFAFHSGAELPIGPSIEGSIEAVLMEVARNLDEGAR